MNKAIMVFGKSQDVADNMLVSILNNNLSKEDIKSIRPHPYSIHMKNGDVYTSRSANATNRGYKWNYAYIDKNIDQDCLYDYVFGGFVPFSRMNNLSFDYERLEKLKDSYELY